MHKKVLVISTSPRKGSNSDQLAEDFIRGAQQSGNTVEKITLRDKTIGFCKGCLSCVRTQRCVIADDANAIVEKMLNSDVIVFATPIYYYGMSGQMKTMLDRSNPLYGSDYQFRDIYLLTAAAEDESSTPEGAIHGLQGWIACFEKAHLAGTIFAGGVNAPGEIQNHPARKEAFDLGAAIQ